MMAIATKGGKPVLLPDAGEDSLHVTANPMSTDAKADSNAKATARFLAMRRSTPDQTQRSNLAPFFGVQSG